MHTGFTIICTPRLGMTTVELVLNVGHSHAGGPSSAGHARLCTDSVELLLLDLVLFWWMSYQCVTKS